MKILMRITVAIAILGTAMLAGCVTETTGGVPPEHTNLAKAAAINTELGAGYAREGFYGRAIEKLKLAIKERDDYAPAHATLAFVYAQTGKAVAAQEQYQRALTLAPDDPDTQNNYGVFLCSQGHGKEAQNYFNQAVKNENYATPEAALTNAGICLWNLNHPHQAIEKFRHALLINPKFASALEQMANMMFQQGKYIEAEVFERRYRRVATPGPGMLLLFSRTERALGHTAKAKEYEILLVQKYPESPEASKIDGQTSQ